MPEMRASNNRKGIATIVFYVIRSMSIARQRVAEYILAEADARNSRRSIASQRLGKQALSTIQDVFSWSPCKVVISESGSEAG
jgi:hypothetical protein